MQERSDGAAGKWIPRIDGASGPIYLAVADAIGRAIAEGELRASERLPTHRALADILDVDLTTITRAYAEARKRGLVQATVGRGTFVGVASRSPPVPPKASEEAVDLGMNLPPVPDDPSLRDAIREGMSQVLATVEPGRLLTYRAGAGTLEERAAGAMWLKPVLGDIDAERVLLSPGAQPVLLALMMVLADAGDVVLTAALTYPGLRTAAAQRGVRLVGIDADSDGLSPDAFEAACKRFRPKALYCIPTIHNPTTATMPLERRRAIAETARRHGVPVIEDDAYGLLPAKALPAVMSLAPDVGFYVATVSKVLSPALRLAYVVAPDARRAERLSAVLRANVLMASPLLTSLATTWIGNGTAASVVSAIRRECVARQRMAREILPAGSFDAHVEGLHLWMRLPPRWNRRDFADHLKRQGGLAVVPSDAFAITERGPPPDGVRISLGAASSRLALKSALRSVAEAVLGEGGAPFSGVV